MHYIRRTRETRITKYNKWNSGPKSTGAKRYVCPGTSESTGSNAPLPLWLRRLCHRIVPEMTYNVLHILLYLYCPQTWTMVLPLMIAIRTWELVRCQWCTLQWRSAADKCQQTNARRCHSSHHQHAPRQTCQRTTATVAETCSATSVQQFLTCDAMHMCSLCCCTVSVHPSIMFVYSDKTNKHIFRSFSSSVVTSF